MKEFTVNGVQYTPGTPYQPSNGTEGELFMEHFCENCVHEEVEGCDFTEVCEHCCDLIFNAMAFSPHEHEYPKEFVINENGNPTCTAFKEK